jgi:hypothetical protein
MQRSSEAKHGTILDQAASFSLIETAARQLDGMGGVARGVLRQGGRKRERERKQGDGDRSFGGTHAASLRACR